MSARSKTAVHVTPASRVAEFDSHAFVVYLINRLLRSAELVNFAAVSHRIWQAGLRNLGEFAAENCGP